MRLAVAATAPATTLGTTFAHTAAPSPMAMFDANHDDRLSRRECLAPLR